MNIHMTSNEWAQYIQTFEPKTKEEAMQYFADLKAYAKRGNIESGIALNRAKRLKVDYPDIDINQMKYEDRKLQLDIQHVFNGFN